MSATLVSSAFSLVTQVRCSQDAIHLGLSEHAWKAEMPILSRSRDGITQRTGEPSLRGGPAEEDPKGRTIRASRCIILGILVELTNVPRRNPVEFCDAGAFQVLGERRQTFACSSLPFSPPIRDAYAQTADMALGSEQTRLGYEEKSQHAGETALVHLFRGRF